MSAASVNVVLRRGVLSAAHFLGSVVPR
jgi:hypothetical protein